MEQDKVSYESLLSEFVTENIIFNALYYKVAKNLNDIDLQSLLLELKDAINYNYEEQIYSESIKTNLYRLLSIYRERFNDGEILNTVSGLITTLNKSGDKNAVAFICEEYQIRFFNQFSKKEQRKIHTLNIQEAEKVVHQSICNDYYFLINLKSLSHDQFLGYASMQSFPLSNLTLMLYDYPEFLKDEGFMPKILDLLYGNIKKLKDKSTVLDEELRAVQYQTEDCLRKIKKYKLDK